MAKEIFVLDTNVLISESRFLNTPNLATVFLSAGYLDYRVFVPKIAVDELVYIYEREARASARELEESLNNVNRLSTSLGVVVDAKMPRIDGRRLVQKYRWALEAELWGYEASLLDYPEISHQSLVRNVSLRSKPFRDNGTGYKDALIWHSFLSVAVADPGCRFWLVSKNHKDFSDATGRKFHPELSRQLADRGIGSEQAGIISSIAEVVDEFFVPFMTRIRRFEDLIQSEPTLPTWLAGEVDTAVGEALHVLTREGIPEDFGFPGDIFQILGFQLQHLEPRSRPRVYMLDEERALLTVEAEASIQYTCLGASGSPLSALPGFELDPFDPEVGTIKLTTSTLWKVSLTLSEVENEQGPAIDESLAILSGVTSSSLLP